MSPNAYVVLSAILFSIGLLGFLIRRNVLIAFMSVELMLNSANLAMVAFALAWGGLEGQVASFFVMVVAAAEVVVGLGIIVFAFSDQRWSVVLFCFYFAFDALCRFFCICIIVGH